MVFVLDIRSYRLITYQNQVIVIGYIVTYGLIGDLVEIKLLPTRFRMFLPIFGNILTFHFLLGLLRLHFWENKGSVQTQMQKCRKSTMVVPAFFIKCSA